MKKIIIFIVFLIVLIILTVAMEIFIPTINKNYKISKYNITMKVPFSYKKIEDENENSLINLYDEEKGITIKSFDLKDDFWSSGDIEHRLDEYMNIMSSANYDAEIENVEKEIIEYAEKKVGKIKFELVKPNSTNKLLTIITDQEIGNVVLEIHGPKESIEKNTREIEEIVNSVKFN